MQTTYLHTHVHDTTVRPNNKLPWYGKSNFHKYKICVFLFYFASKIYDDETMEWRISYIQHSIIIKLTCVFVFMSKMCALQFTCLSVIPCDSWPKTGSSDLLKILCVFEEFN